MSNQQQRRLVKTAVADCSAAQNLSETAATRSDTYAALKISQRAISLIGEDSTALIISEQSAAAQIGEDSSGGLLSRLLSRIAQQIAQQQTGSAAHW